jgi:hypothetical protein
MYQSCDSNSIQKNETLNGELWTCERLQTAKLKIHESKYSPSHREKNTQRPLIEGAEGMFN